ncbi:hypothetical protein VCR15J2_390064 [Vibrio coralliirubri]|uniref:hypothetical protein n=1 Tax=Vibrio coralliirubri TaxID=1516159 RepID=UPI000637B34D|nr:hypothetical protein [Vibrio coralliirubri]CDT53386.1 hypothetical protein VCR15J2_390064 [Vibrio coralliirubri]
MKGTIELLALVHPIESQARGFLYVALTNKLGVTYHRISSADATGTIHVSTFENQISLLNEASNKCRFTNGYVMQSKTDGISEMLSSGHQQMLVECLQKEFPNLFGNIEGKLSVNS